MTEIKNSECSKSIRSYEKSNAWNIKRLVGGSIGQTNDRSIVLFHKLSDFNNHIKIKNFGKPKLALQMCKF